MPTDLNVKGLTSRVGVIYENEDVKEKEEDIKSIHLKCRNCILYDEHKLPNCSILSNDGGAGLSCNQEEVNKNNFSTIFAGALCGLGKSKNIYVAKR